MHKLIFLISLKKRIWNGYICCNYVFGYISLFCYRLHETWVGENNVHAYLHFNYINKINLINCSSGNVKVHLWLLILMLDMINNDYFHKSGQLVNLVIFFKLMDCTHFRCCWCSVPEGVIASRMLCKCFTAANLLHILFLGGL